LTNAHWSVRQKYASSVALHVLYKVSELANQFISVRFIYVAIYTPLVTECVRPSAVSLSVRACYPNVVGMISLVRHFQHAILYYNYH